MIKNFLGRQLAATVLYPAIQPFPKSPSDYDITYRDVEFPARDGVVLSGWLLNEGQHATIVMTHFGYRANRFGYQVKFQPRLTRPYTKDVEFVLVAKRLVDAGYSVLMYDLRNHGLSGKSQLGVGTGGVDEAHDVLGAVDFVSSEVSKGAIGLLSYCMGANATFYAQGMDPQAFVSKNVAALVAMQQLRNGDFLEAYGISKWLRDAAERHYTRQTHLPLNPPILDHASKIVTPTLLLQARKDPWTKLDFVEDLFATLPVEKKMEWLEEPTHRFDGYNWFADHPDSMLDWFARHIPSAGTTVS